MGLYTEYSNGINFTLIGHKDPTQKKTLKFLKACLL